MLGGAKQIRGKGTWYIILAAEIDPERKLIHPATLGLSADITEEEARHHADQMSRQAKEDEVMRRKAPPKLHGEILCRDWFELWHAWREAAGIVGNARHDRGRVKEHALPIIGDLPMRAVTKIDLQRVVMSLDQKVTEGVIAAKTAANAWGNCSTAFYDASHGKNPDLVVRDDDPSADVAPPNPGEPPAKQFLYPDEFWTLITSDEVWNAKGKRVLAARNALRWMRCFVLNVYLELREGELRALEWPDFNFDNWVCTVTRAVERDTGGKKTKEPKTGVQRQFVVEENARPLLLVMRAEAIALARKKHGSKWDGSLSGRIINMPHECDLSPRLRQYCGWAGITRAALYEDTRVSRRLTFKDLRATGLTWRALRGDSAKKIQRDVGHKLASTTDIYIRTADDVRDDKEKVGEVPPFPPLPEALFGKGGFEAARKAEEAWAARRDLREHSGSKTGKPNGYRSLVASPAGFEPTKGEYFSENIGGCSLSQGAEDPNRPLSMCISSLQEDVVLEALRVALDTTIANGSDRKAALFARELAERRAAASGQIRVPLKVVRDREEVG